MELGKKLISVDAPTLLSGAHSPAEDTSVTILDYDIRKEIEYLGPSMFEGRRSLQAAADFVPDLRDAVERPKEAVANLKRQ